eukprot:6178957-Amphidinium_carterae.1
MAMTGGLGVPHIYSKRYDVYNDIHIDNHLHIDGPREAHEVSHDSMEAWHLRVLHQRRAQVLGSQR